MSDFEKLKEKLPSNEKLYSFLTGKKISDNEYEHNEYEVFHTFQMKMMKDYHNLYLKYDILLLAGDFE